MPKDIKTEDPNNNIRLSERDRKILGFVARYRLVTLDILWRVFFPNHGRDAAKSTLRRLMGKGPTFRYLRPQSLDGKRMIYRLTKRGCLELNVSPKLARPLGPRARVERLAVLAFIHESDNSRKIISSQRLREFLQIHPDDRVPKSPFFMETQSDKSTRLGVIFTDCGGHPRGIATRTVRKVSHILDEHWLDEEIRTRRFTVTILTGRVSKVSGLKNAITASLNADLEWATRSLLGDVDLCEFIRVDVVHVPEIEGLVVGRSDRRHPPKKPES